MKLLVSTDVTLCGELYWLTPTARVPLSGSLVGALISRIKLTTFHPFWNSSIYGMVVSTRKVTTMTTTYVHTKMSIFMIWWWHLVLAWGPPLFVSIILTFLSHAYSARYLLLSPLFEIIISAFLSIAQSWCLLRLQPRYYWHQVSHRSFNLPLYIWCTPWNL